MLASLAAGPDLDARGIAVASGQNPEVLLAAASAAVREAAGHPIAATTSTVTLVAQDWCELDLPAGPVTTVASVTVASVPVTGWTKIGDTLYMPTGWTQCLPVEVVVTYTHGLPVVPADIVDLVCGMVSIAASRGDNGGYGEARQTSVRLGDYSESFSPPPAGADSPSPFAIPDRVRESLRARFGTNAAMVRIK